MSIVNELQRILQAKTALKGKFTNYDVVVGDDEIISEYPNKVDEVYTTGYNTGYEKGKAEGGSNEYYNDIWSSALPTESVNGTYLFAGACWNDTTFIPDKDIKPTTAESMFYFCRITDLVTALEKSGKVLDFSNCTNFNMMIYGSSITHIGVVDMTKVSSANNANSVFRGGGGHPLQKIDKVIVSETYPLGSNSLGNCVNLTDIDIEGTITGTFYATSCVKLTAQSAKNIITHLANYTGTDKEFTQSVKFHANVWALLDADGATSPNNNTWREYVQDLGWLT